MPVLVDEPLARRMWRTGLATSWRRPWRRKWRRIAAEVGAVEVEEETLALRETAKASGTKTYSGAVPGPA